MFSLSHEHRHLLEQGAIIERQRAELQELAAPVIQVWDGILTLAIVDELNHERAAAVTASLLARVIELRARFALLDITAIEAVDAATAGHFVRIVRAVQLLGAECILTGIRSAVAQSMIATGVELGHVITLATLQDGLSYCLRCMGLRVAST